MVWAGVSCFGKTPLVILTNVKINKETYIDTILVPHVQPLKMSMFSGADLTLQQDSAPSHAARQTQQWCQQNLPGFISKPRFESP